MNWNAKHPDGIAGRIALFCAYPVIAPLFLLLAAVVLVLAWPACFWIHRADREEQS